MPIRLQPISIKDLTSQERESILSHAIDLHLVGSDDADSVGFDIVEKKSTDVLHLLRVLDRENEIGVVYLLPVRSESSATMAIKPDMVEMTVLIFPEFRGKHYTAPMVENIERFLKAQYPKPPLLCAGVHEHSPMRKELTEFLLRHGYRYSADQRMFVKQLG